MTEHTGPTKSAFAQTGDVGHENHQLTESQGESYSKAVKVLQKCLHESDSFITNAKSRFEQITNIVGENTTMTAKLQHYEQTHRTLLHKISDGRDNLRKFMDTTLRAKDDGQYLDLDQAFDSLMEGRSKVEFELHHGKLRLRILQLDASLLYKHLVICHKYHEKENKKIPEKRRETDGPIPTSLEMTQLLHWSHELSQVTEEIEVELVHERRDAIDVVIKQAELVLDLSLQIFRKKHDTEQSDGQASNHHRGPDSKASPHDQKAGRPREQSSPRAVRPGDQSRQRTGRSNEQARQKAAQPSEQSQRKSRFLEWRIRFFKRKADKGQNESLGRRGQVRK